MIDIENIKREVQVLKTILKSTATRAERLQDELERMAPVNPRRRRNLKKEGIERHLIRLANK